MLETMVCLSIIVVLAALAFPAFGESKRNSKRSQALSNLRQLYIAIAVYRTQEGGDGIYGAPEQMGLPLAEGPFPTPFDALMNREKDFWKSPCGLNRSWFPPEPGSKEALISVIYRPADREHFKEYSRLYRSNSLLFCDVNCDDPDAPIGNRYLNHRGLGVLVEGQLVNNYKPGLMLTDDSWWSAPPGE